MTEGQSWTLIARVSNKGGKHWTRGSGWWNKHDMTDAKGKTTDPLDGEDMISPAFWLVGGKEFMITRSDDLHTAPLLQTTDDCLDEQTFGHKIHQVKVVLYIISVGVAATLDMEASTKQLKDLSRRVKTDAHRLTFRPVIKSGFGAAEIQLTITILTGLSWWSAQEVMDAQKQTTGLE